MARILISVFCVFILNRTQVDATTAPPTPYPNITSTPSPPWETKDLGGLMFSVMPNAGVSFRSAILSNMTEITLCLRIVKDKLNLKDDQLQIMFGKNPATTVSIHNYYSDHYYQLKVADSYMILRLMSTGTVQGVPSLWNNRCFTWDSSSGMAQLWFNGMMSVRRGLSRGTVFSGQAELTLFEFEGQISDVYMWDSALSIKKLYRYLYHHSVPSQGSVLAWTQIEFKASGYVVLEPAYPKWFPAVPAKCNKQKRMKGRKKQHTQKFNPVFCPH